MKAESKNPDCPICKLFMEFDHLCKDFPEIESKDTDNSVFSVNYAAIRGEMIESFSRVANARNWALIVFFGGVTVISSSDSFKCDPNMVAFLTLFSSSMLFLLANFAFNAYATVWDMRATLLALEVKKECHFSNEHEFWTVIMEISGGNVDNFYYKNYGVSPKSVVNKIEKGLKTNNVQEFEDIFNQQFSKKFKVNDRGRAFNLLLLDFYFWLSLFNIIMTVFFWYRMNNHFESADIIAFVASLVLQIILFAFIGCFVYMERKVRKLALLESVFKYIRLKRGVHLKVWYSRFYKFFGV